MARASTSTATCSSATYDEYRYHEALVHPALMHRPDARSVLVLGGGDGLALREVLKYPQVRHVDLVDLDPAMTRLFTENASFRALNHEAFLNPRVSVHNADAFTWLREGDAHYDVVIIDFPDPNNFALGKLLSLVGAIAGSIAGVMVGTPVPVIGSFVMALLGGAGGAFAGAYLGEMWKGREEDARVAAGKEHSSARSGARSANWRAGRSAWRSWR